MKKIILLILVSLMVLISPASWANERPPPEECKILEQEVNEYIESQNFCKQDEDCALTLVRCPFKCVNYVNKNSLGQVNKRIENFLEKSCSSCLYECIASSGAICLKNKCYDKNMIPQ